MIQDDSPRRNRVLNLELLEDRLVLDNSLGQISNPTALFVAGLYSDLLHRAPSTTEVASWVQAIQRGTTEAAVAKAFAQSSEFLSSEVSSLYQSILGRTPSSGEVSPWVQSLQNGLSLEQITARLLGSDEFFAKSGQDDTSWLKAVYQLELNRAADPDGLRGYLKALTDGTDRGTVALDILNSPEGAGDMVAALYHTLLNRQPDGDETAGWANPISQGLDGNTVIADIAGSAEFAQLQMNLGAAADAPLPWEVNVGQTDSSVGFLAHGSDYNLFLTPTSLVAALPTSTNPATATQAVSISLQGGNADAMGVGQDLMASKTNYFVGNDPSQWLTNIANYGQVQYTGVYNGIDAVYVRTQTAVELIYVVHPGADPSQIRLSVQGGTATITADGSLQITLPGSSSPLVIEAPQTYQLDDKGVRQAVASAWVMNSDGTISFQVERYDSTRDLVIDPTVLYATYIGSSGTDHGNGVATDANGNFYVTGTAGAADFPSQPGLGFAFGGQNDAFVAEFNASGALVYSSFLGGSGGDDGNSIAIGSDGSVYVGGDTGSSNFPIVGGFQTNIGSLQSGFITKINAAGNAIIYSSFIGGSSFNQVNGVALDPFSDVYLVGSTQSNNFPVTSGAFQTTYGGNQDAFVAKISPDGSTELYASYFGGSQEDLGNAIAVDSSGDAYITGLTLSPNLAVSAGAFQPTLSGTAQNAYVAKINPTGSLLAYASYLGGAENNTNGNGIAVDAGGDAYVTGFTNSTNGFPVTAGAYLTTVPPYVSGATPVAFVTKVNQFGTSLVYSTFIGGGSTSSGVFGDEGRAITLDSEGNAYVAGSTGTNGFPVVDPILAMQSGFYNWFVSVLNSQGSALLFSTYLDQDSTIFDSPRSIALDSSNNIIVAGNVDSTNFPATPGAFQGTKSGGSGDFGDAFVIKISAITSATPVTPVSPPSSSSSSSGSNSSSSESEAQLQTKIFYPLRYIYDAANGTFDGNLTIFEGAFFSGLSGVTVAISGLPNGASVVNGTETSQGVFEITVNGNMQPGDVLRIPLQIQNPTKAPLSTYFVGFNVQLIAG